MYSLSQIMTLESCSMGNSMQSLHSETDDSVREQAEIAQDERLALTRQIEALTEGVRRMRVALNEK